MVLDSSGTCDGERRMAVGNTLVARVRDRNPMEVAHDLGRRFWRLSGRRRRAVGRWPPSAALQAIFHPRRGANADGGSFAN